MRGIARWIALIALSTCLSVNAFAADTWKIGVGGGRITGYMGLLASHGMPREYLTDEELADIDVLRQYRAVIATAESNPRGISQALEQFVAEGGIAITEERVAPPPSVIPGKRLGPASAPNIDFRGFDNPISQAMQSAGVVTVYARPGIAIIPDNPDKVTVLAKYTEQGVPDRYRGKLLGGKKNIPAVIMVQHGKGKWLHFGPRVGFSLALRGPEMQPAILTALREMSDGVLVPRFASLNADRRLIPTVQWEPEMEEVMPRSAPRNAEPADLPEGFEALDLPADAPADYVITGTLPAGGEATVLLPWFNGDHQQRLEIGRGLRMVDVSDGRESVVAEGPRPDAGQEARLDIRRRPRSLTVFINGRACLMAALEPLAGTQASRGITDAFLQSCAPVRFTDNFMRAEGDPNPWETPAGSWKLFRVEGEPGQGANPFAFRAEAEQGAVATATSGYWFWDDYDAGVSVRPNCASVSLMTNWQADDDCIELRLTMPAMDDASNAAKLDLIRRLPSGNKVLGSADVTATADCWHRLRLKVSRGHAVASLNERELIKVADDLVRGHGQVALQNSGGFAHFDDVRVQAWQAAPLPLDGGAWLAERGKVDVKGGEVTLEPMGSARAIAPMTEQADLRASARMQRGGAELAGLMLRYESPGDHYLVAVAEGDGGGSELQVIRTERNKNTVLASAPLSGGAGRWHDVTATLRGRQMRVTADNGPSIDVADEVFADGEFGLTCDGGPAHFRDVTCWPIDHERFAADPETPPYAGIIDLHTWAGAGSGWEPAAADLDLFWHRGMYIGDAEVRLGVHRTGKGAAAGTLLIGDGVDPASGYALTASQPSSGEPVSISLARTGEEVANGEARAWGAEGWALSLQRVGSLVVGRLDGKTVCAYRDPQPLTEMHRVGFRKDNAVIDPADAEVLSSAVRTWTFSEAPADWRVDSGTWEISNRWSCSPEWTWLAGWNQEGPALIQSRKRFMGDQVVDIYVGTKMMPKPGSDGYYEELRDLHFGLCGDEDGGGYDVVLGADDGNGAKLVRNGETVATNNSYSIPQAERHNNWLLVRLEKKGDTITVYDWDSEVLSYTDDDPLPSGSISVGTERNGITVPRVTIYAEPER